jgi:hypothetical protein
VPRVAAVTAEPDRRPANSLAAELDRRLAIKAAGAA